MEYFGRYQLVEKIGSGGMAEVFLARTTVARGLTKRLVIKKILPGYARSPHFVSMFVDEAKIALSLNHPNIVQVFDFGTVNGSFYLAMEFVDGVDLLQLLRGAAANQTSISFSMSAYIVQQVVRGLHYAHTKKDEFGTALDIVHRDVSPQNVLLSWDGAVKLVDFGIARARGTTEETGMVKGKFAYMSPEQARGKEVDARSDIYAAGILLFELATGKPMHTGNNKELLKHVRDGAVVPPRSKNPNVPVGLERIILKALSYHPDDRYQDGAEFQRALAEFQMNAAQKGASIIDSDSVRKLLSAAISSPSQPEQTSPKSTGTASSSSTNGLTRENKHVFLIRGELRRGDSPGAVQYAFEKLLRDITYKFHGHVERITPQEFLILVGVPFAAEDDSYRTIALARALVDAVQGMAADYEGEVGLKMGIHRALITRSSQQSGAFSYSIPEKELMALERLLQGEELNELRVTKSAYMLLRDEWSVVPIEVEGDYFDTQAQTQGDSKSPRSETTGIAWRIRGPKPKSERVRNTDSPRVIHRPLVVKSLRDVFRDVQNTQSKRFVTLFGEEGIGKRTLLNAFLNTLDPKTTIIVRTRARVSQAYTPYASLADFIREMLGLTENAGPAETMERIERLGALLFSEAPDSPQAKRAAELAGMILGAVPSSEQLDVSEKRERLAKLMLLVEKKFGAGKTVIWVGEDVHWCDDETRELFRRVMGEKTQRPILGLSTSRPDMRLEREAREAGGIVLEIGPLSQTQSEEMIRSYFADASDISPLVDVILAHAQGNPLYVRELLRQLEETGVIKPTEIHGPRKLYEWVKRDTELEVPPTIESLLQTRLDRFPPEEKRTLLFASVWGLQFSAEQVAELTGVPSESMLNGAVKKAVLVRQGNYYSFRSRLMMSVAYQLLAPEDRQTLHGQAVDYLLAQKLDQRKDAIIARHLELAGQSQDAARRYIKASEYAVRVGGVSDALRQLARASKLLPQDDIELLFETHKAQESILERLGQRARQYSILLKLVDLSTRLGTPERRAYASSRLTQFFLDMGRLDEATEEIAKASGFATQSDNQELLVEVIRQQAEICQHKGQPDQAVLRCNQALALLDPEHLDLRSSILLTKGAALYAQSENHSALEVFAEVLVIAQHLGIRRTESEAMHQMGRVFASLDEYEEALSHYKTSIEIDRSIGERRLLPQKLHNVGRAYVDLGDTAGALPFLKAAIEMSMTLDDDRTSASVRTTMGQLHLQEGDIPKAKRELRQAISLATTANDRFEEIRAQTYLAWAILDARENPREALELASRSSYLAEHIGSLISQAYALAIEALALSRLGQSKEAMSKSETAIALRESHQRAEGSEQIYYLRARVARRCDEPGEYRKALELSAKEIQKKLSRLSDEQLRSAYSTTRLREAVNHELAQLHV